MWDDGRRARRILIALTATAVFATSCAAVAYFWRSFLPVDPLKEARTAYDRQDWDAAARAARARLKTANGDLDALRLLARASLRQGKESSALAIYGGLGEDAMESDDFYLLGMEQSRKGNVDLAHQAWKLALTRNPNHPETLAATAKSLSEMDQYIPAVVTIQQLLTQPGWKARANLLLGEMYVMMNAPEQVITALERGLNEPGESIDPKDRERYRKLLARSFLQTGKPARAREVLEPMQPAGATSSPDLEVSWLLSRCDLQESKPISPTVLDQARTYRDEHPLEAEPASYVGAAGCVSCHRVISDMQQPSRHGRTFFRESEIAALPLPKQPVPDPGDPKVVHSFQKVEDHVEVETKIDDRVVRSIIDYAFGTGDRGLTLVGRNDKNHYFESRLSYYGNDGKWDVTSGQSRIPQHSALYQGSILTLDVVRRCIICHQTNAMAVLSNSGPEAADRAIGCEKCHGPGGNHLLAVNAPDAKKDPSLFLRDMAIARPSMTYGEPIVKLCGQCHDPRKVGFEVTPSLETASRFQSTTLSWSRCYTESQKALDCVTCHSPHRDAETSPAHYEAKCLECHSGTPSPPKEPRSLLRPRQTAFTAAPPCPVQPKSGCIACHMPKDQTPIPHSQFTDHHIRVHPELTESKPPIAGR
ncbi:cytochrome c3 family protein [Paludisphaera borealis]|uniref:Cytochrome c-552/4 domain-containing protein n=1 Tax=Paludisphaera borealis TaxID=1387353 RepID=A0A1U7CQJ5_9BACT|nr:cytochrome c3 family protein [Paludisphaera borealis]APW61178.1 hypothetical protein BSF38_02682 [Paludisphaera borealis]